MTIRSVSLALFGIAGSVWLDQGVRVDLRYVVWCVGNPDLGVPPIGRAMVLRVEISS
jgi:hypothetical protein